MIIVGIYFYHLSYKSNPSLDMHNMFYNGYAIIIAVEAWRSIGRKLVSLFPFNKTHLVP